MRRTLFRRTPPPPTPRGPLAAVQRWDLEAYRRTARWHAPLLDKTLPRLSTAANKSLLWSVLALLIGWAGGRFGRRAGARGLFGVALASIVGNLQALAVRRKRPVLDEVPMLRRLARHPTSHSFPSRHSASAFAFATGVALERPALAAPLYPLAAAVAYSRVYTGALLGAGMALATRHFWPVAPESPARARPETVALEERPDADGSGLAIVVNAAAGSGSGASHADVLREALPGAEIIEAGDDLPMDDALEKAEASGRAIGICGGDGSVNAAARLAFRTGKPLVVFPGGTLNHFAHALGIESMDDAVQAVRSGEPVGIDVGLIADKPFLNTASFGNYVELVDAREKLEDRIGKWPAVVVALARVLAKAEPIRIEIDGTPTTVWMAFIGNCRYHPDGFTPSWRDRLDDGLIDIRLVDARRPLARFRLVWAVLTGTLSRSKVYSCRTVEDPMRVRALDGPLRLSRDGETFSGPAEFTIAKAPERLKVFVPPVDDED